jgi:SAM-dependent methyltransferase
VTAGDGSAPRTERAVDWAAYLATYHDANPGITEDLLAEARDETGLTPYDWLVEAVGDATTVVDVACGNGPVARRLPGRRVVGVDRSEGELTRARWASAPALLTRAEATALPVGEGTADALTISLALMLLTPLEVVLGEAARVLRQGGILAATVPVRSDAKGAFADLLAELGQTRVRYPQALDPTTLEARFVEAGLELNEDTARTFVRPLGEDEVELLVRAFYAPGTTPEDLRRTAERLRDCARDATIDVPYRIRRLVGRRVSPKAVRPTVLEM